LDGIEIRSATVSDTPVIAHIINEAWKIAYVGVVPQPVLDNLSEAKKVEHLKTGLERCSAMRYYLLEVDGVPLGASCLHPAQENELPDAAEFSFFYFLPHAWRHGYGTILLHHLIDEASKQGYRQLCCWVLADNSRAIAFYESQGMLHDGKWQTVKIGKDLTTVRCIVDLPFNE
jgi:GNAT superfamily N-acetyltransferase